jgi:hypothetical protein
VDAFEKKHLQNWLDSVFAPRHQKERDELEKDLTKLTDEYPELLKTHTWPEMHRLVIRTGDGMAAPKCQLESHSKGDSNNGHSR